MNDFHHSRDNLNRSKKPSKKKRQLSELDKEVEAYIMSSDDSFPLLRLANILKAMKIPPQMAKRVVKESIKASIEDYNSDMGDYNLYLTRGLEDALDEFNLDRFMERSWQYQPIALKDQDYRLLNEVEKYPIFIDSYNYSLPIHTFGNNINFHNEHNFSKKKIINNNDIQFYTTKDENMLFAKVTNIKFEPISYVLIKEAVKNMPADSRTKLQYNPTLYNRTFSISLYVLLEGDPNKSHPYLRYDSNPCTHTNTFLGGDKRLEVYGLEADNPHFHFQNEDDALLCIRKYRDSGRHIRWKTGKCNAIDCKHLVRYLALLDNLEQRELHRQEEQNLSYGMPFLDIKLKGKKIITKSVDKLLDEYPLLDEKSGQLIDMLRESFKMLYPVKATQGDKSFKRLITSLRFLQLLHDEQSNTLDEEKLEILSNLEIECASDVVGAISSCSQKIIEKDYKPKFIISNQYLDSKGEGEEKEN